ncbi:putative general secretion pathway protein B [Vibrio ichthyoenteri ATCC 700023]|uniref:Putative general secretion pathway protein B n=1 Tax=Vibrio ichthyoenteri ATCC 700023 TaxID=870968 RepID=F9RWI7_9VIBR|nr:general secretion pathway protein GspB [Vibrio ichthyoenteri]EGU49244.1 putative general secretion pathway protein B [Vibrio ichthyoenteri ATCC 700023]
MANLIEQLSASQQGYQSHHTAPLQYQLSQAGTQPKRWPLNLALLVIPSLATLTWLAYGDYQMQRDAWVAMNQGKVEIVEQPAVLENRPYPQYSALTETFYQRDLNDETLMDESLSVSDSPETRLTNQPVEKNSFDTKQKQQVSEDDLLSGLDLSGLSPDIAQRLQAVMDAPEVESADDEQIPAQALAENINQWSGRLPALNFETHVYSSNEAKRWVKINGVEYQQGDQIGNDVALMAIEPQACVIDFQGEMIRIPALYDWQG